MTIGRVVYARLRQMMHGISLVGQYDADFPSEKELPICSFHSQSYKMVLTRFVTVVLFYNLEWYTA